MSAMSGILLAGGRSRRMGRDKAFLEVGGQPLAVRALRVLDEVCEDVVVASGDGRRLAALGRPQVADVVGDAGPLAGIVAGLEGCRHDLAAVLAVDLVRASAAVLELLAGAWGGEAAVVPVVGGRAQPLHAVWARSAAPALRKLLDAGERSAGAAAMALGGQAVGPEVWGRADPGGRFATNLNEPADLTGPEV
jgi:molybdopterin-guanine dinucleotide biosynthesis protein A